jgi:hypothetical protein
MKRVLFAEDPPPLSETIFETSRPRYNEAALVARKNPELDEFIRRSSGSKVQTETKPQDPVLQRAVDMLLARSLLGSSSLDWDQQTPRPPSTIRKATRAP